MEKKERKNKVSDRLTGPMLDKRLSYALISTHLSLNEHTNRAEESGRRII